MVKNSLLLVLVLNLMGISVDAASRLAEDTKTEKYSNCSCKIEKKDALGICKKICTCDPNKTEVCRESSSVACGSKSPMKVKCEKKDNVTKCKKDGAESTADPVCDNTTI